MRNGWKRVAVLSLTVLLVVALSCAKTPTPTAAPTSTSRVVAATPTTSPTPTAAPIATPRVLAATPTPAPTPTPIPTPTPRRPQGTITIAVSSLGEGGGLADMNSAVGMSTLAHVQEHLIQEGNDGQEMPGLAEKFEMSPDGSTVTFKLRKGVQWHDGWGEFTSADVKFSIDTLITRTESKATLSAWFRDSVASIETPDPYTVIVQIKKGKESFDFFTQIDTNPPRFPISSKKYVETVGRDVANKKWIGTGPWKFVELKTGDYAKFEAVEGHWRQTPDFKYLVLKEVPDAATQVMMLLAGDVDAINVMPQSVAELEKAGFTLFSSPGHAYYVGFGGQYLPTRETFDPKLPWVADPADPVAWERAKKVRLAMNLAVDKEKIFKTILGGKGVMTAVPVMLPFQPGYDPKWKPYPYDPKKAQELLKEAGYPKGFPVDIRLFTISGREAMADVGQAVGMYLTDIGLDVKLSRIDYTGVMAPDQRNRKLRSLFTYAMIYPEALGGWKLLSYSKSSVMWFGEHPWLDQMIDKGMVEFDPVKRAEIQRQIGQWYIDNAYTIPIGSSTVDYAGNPKKMKSWPMPPAMVYPLNIEYITRAQ